MFTAKNIAILLIVFFIFQYEAKCQQPGEISINEMNFAGKDSIDKKHNSAFLDGKDDAKEYYNDNRAFAISFLTSLLLPPVGVVTTIAISLKKPQIEILDVPNKLLLKNEDYTKGYIHKAKSMKALKAWGGCVVGLAFFGFGFYMLYGIN